MDEDKLDKIVNKHKGDAGALIEVLLEIQHENNWLPNEALEKVSEKLGVPLSKVQHTATFYKAFNLVPEGHHEIHVCDGTSCHIRGSKRVVSAIQDAIGVKPGTADPESRFSLKTVNCLGCCGSAPVVVVDGKYHGNVEPAKTKDVLRDTR